MALSLPPWGWWPLAWLGLAGLYSLIEDEPWRRRLLLGWVAGLGQFGIGLFWMLEFTLPGGLLAIVFSALFIAAAAALTPASGGWRRAIAFPAALLLCEAVRVRWPFGGTPPGGLSLGQIAGPLGATARIGGPLLLGALAAAVAVGLAGRGWARRVVPVGIAIALGVLAVVAPAGESTGESLDVGLVQGGGRRGFRASETDADAVYQRHLDATDRLRGRLDLILWPEDVIDIEGDIGESTAADDLAAVALRHQATLVAGVVEGEGSDHFRNAAVAWSPAGEIVGRYEKFHRVPFGEFVPFRSLVEKVADLSDVPADAIVGTTPNVLDTPAGRLGVAISYEVFFVDRGREATARRAGVILVPTNAASFTTSQVPTQEIAAAQLLAVSSGRTVLQAAPTGYSAVITHDGRVRARSVLGRQQVIHARAPLRRGRTLYARMGDYPLLVVAAGALLTARSRIVRSRVASSPT